MKPERLAAIDIGTNSIRSIVVEVDPTGATRVLDDEKVAVRLGEGLHENGVISPAACKRAMDALSRLKKIIEGFGVRAIEAVATSAVRKAANGAEFIEAIRQETGLDVSVISGEEEAELAAYSAFNNFELEGTRQLLVDIGGGSLELVTTVGHHIDEITSLELGAVYLTETFLRSDPVTDREHQRLRRQIRKTIKSTFASELIPTAGLIGSGGTITAIGSMIMASRREEYGSLHGYELLRSDVVHLLAMLLRKNTRELRSIPGLNPDRADIIIAGVTVVDELMDIAQANLLRVNERGIREGLILKGLHRHKLVDAGKRSRSWRASLLDFAASCHFDERHSLQVARLSLEIFAGLAKPYKLGDSARRILEAAAILHDVGYFINYSSHHKHSYHLIRHADLFGFTPRERELIAHVARYHRKSLPKKKHDQYMRLSPADRLLVSRLGGILRLADGLDRRRNSAVSSLDFRLERSTFRIRLHGRDDLSVEQFGGQAKGDLLQTAFDLGLELEAVPDGAGSASS
ncbi:MAG: Ppx/GppA family phosphatase [Geobacter sp.]|nr:Ppx/GppA family phosphatase [Geobacter sp.]